MTWIQFIAVLLMQVVNKAIFTLGQAECEVAMNRIRVVSPRTSDEEKCSSARRQILLLLGTRLRAGRSYYSEGLVRSPTEPGSPTVNGLTDDLQSCRSYSPCRCLTARPICLGGSALWLGTTSGGWLRTQDWLRLARPAVLRVGG